jgi:hypothetical protein
VREEWIFVMIMNFTSRVDLRTGRGSEVVNFKIDSAVMLTKARREAGDKQDGDNDKSTMS